MDTFRQKPSLSEKFLLMRNAVKAAVPRFKSLQANCEDYRFENYPPDIGNGFYIAVGRKPSEG